LLYSYGIRNHYILNIQGQLPDKKPFSLNFVDLCDYEKLQTNIIDSMKLYESIVVNNSFNSTAKLLGAMHRNEQ